LTPGKEATEMSVTGYARTALALIGLVAAVGSSAADHLAGYLVDGSGQAVRSGFGDCFRTGSWSSTRPGIGCDASPERVVLLPGPDGNVGKVVVFSAGNERVLDSAYAGAEIGQGGAITLRNEDASAVQKRYAGALGAQPPRPMAFVVNFVSGSATELTPESRRVIEEVKAALAGRPAPEITVIGHTDRVGKLEANDALSRKRAETVRDILAASGVKALSLDVAGRGEREPLVATADEVDEPRNRRVEISVR
jgi:outer membrane protein OmpA-like peptidoglycan-associated protein